MRVLSPTDYTVHATRRFHLQTFYKISINRIPKPGKFEPRAEKGWFLGFQQNTSKNYIIYHPQRTPTQGLKWVLSFTPHVTFNEDVMFGDKPEPVFIASTNPSTSTLAGNSQTASHFEGEHQPLLSKDDTIDTPLASDINNEAPLSQDINMESPGPESAITDSLSPEVSFTNPVPTQCNSLLPIEVCHSPQSISAANDILIYEELQTSLPPAQTTQLKLTHQSLADRQVQPSQIDLVPLELETSYQQEKSRNENETSYMVKTHPKLEAQGEPHSEETELEVDNASLDFIMTGWQPIPPITGKKRKRSPEPTMVETRHERKEELQNAYVVHRGQAKKNILESIDLAHAAEISHLVEPKEMWDYLNLKYEGENFQRLHQLTRDLLGISKLKNMPVDANVSRLQALNRSIAQQNPKLELPEEWLLKILIVSMPDEYETKMAIIKSINAQLTLGYVHARLREKETLMQAPIEQLEALNIAK
ncbi:hypothetical protein GcM3_206031, partial [Golovinomyces cichoracearum]